MVSSSTHQLANTGVNSPTRYRTHSDDRHKLSRFTRHVHQEYALDMVRDGSQAVVSRFNDKCATRLFSRLLHLQWVALLLFVWFVSLHAITFLNNTTVEWMHSSAHYVAVLLRLSLKFYLSVIPLYWLMVALLSCRVCVLYNVFIYTYVDIK